MRQLSLITIFSTLLFVGLADVTNSQAENLDGIVKGVSFCDDGQGVAVKEKRINLAMFDIDQSGVPAITALVTVDGTVFSLSGNALAKNTIFGVFQLFGDDGATSELAMNGKYKLDGNGTLVKVSGIFQTQDLGALCITLGKFKAVNNAL